MQKLVKLIIVSIFLSSGILYAQTMDEKILAFEKNRFSKNTRLQIKSISTFSKKKLSYGKWYGFIVDVKAIVAGQEVKGKDVIFSDGNIVVPELFDINNRTSFRNEINPKLSAKYYDKLKLIAGTALAKDKIVVFSDPLCPFCIEFVPDLIKYVKKNNKSIALYYYHFPLSSIHPASIVLAKLMILAKEKEIKDVELKVYKIDWSKYFSEKETDEKVIIDAFNKEFKTLFTQAQVDKKTVIDEIKSDITMGENVLVEGTPSIFINGTKDQSRLKYKTLGK